MATSTNWFLESEKFVELGRGLFSIRSSIVSKLSRESGKEKMTGKNIGKIRNELPRKS
jgi:DNA-directed RNA polymerase specialized sigma54-like protein